MELNDKQLEVLERRKIEFKELLKNKYNEYLNKSAKFVPVYVAGPSNYPIKKMEKVNDSMNKTLEDMRDKIDKFYSNTDKMLKNSYSKEEIIDKYRNGYSEPIKSDDPLAKEKLQAKLEYLEEQHKSCKEFNKNARKNGTEQLAWYTLPYLLKEIRTIKERLEQLETINTLEEDNYFFDKGEVRFDKEDNRVKIYFNEKPDVEIREELKHHAFKWSPKNECWQRQLTMNAIRDTKNLFNEIILDEIDMAPKI